MLHLIFGVDQDSGFRTVTHYDLDSSGFEAQWGARSSIHFQTGPKAHQLASTRGTRALFPGVKQPGHDLYWPPTPSSTRLSMGRVTPLLPVCASHGMLQVDFYLYLYLICNNKTLATEIIIEWRKLHCYSYVVWYIEFGNNRLYIFYIFWVKQLTTVFCAGAKTEGTNMRVMENWT